MTMTGHADATAEIYVAGAPVTATNPVPIIAGGSLGAGTSMADMTVELWTSGAPVSTVNAIPIDLDLTEVRRTELDYAQILVNTTTSSGTAADIAGLSIDALVATRPIEVEFCLAAWSGTDVGSIIVIELKEGATVLNTMIAQTLLTGLFMTGGTFKVRLAPSAGTHTYRLTFRLGGGTGSVTAYGNVNFPFALSAKEV